MNTYTIMREFTSYVQWITLRPGEEEGLSALTDEELSAHLDAGDIVRNGEA